MTTQIDPNAQAAPPAHADFSPSKAFSDKCRSPFFTVATVLLSLGLTTVFSAACGVRAPPRPPLSNDDATENNAPKNPSINSIYATENTPQLKEANDPSRGGMEGAKGCDACELRESPTIQ